MALFVCLCICLFFLFLLFCSEFAEAFSPRVVTLKKNAVQWICRISRSFGPFSSPQKILEQIFSLRSTESAEREQQRKFVV
jgi:hypothetical protein